jgi:Zn-finger nucleic acid-binding protein
MLTVGWPRKMSAKALLCTHCGGAIGVEDDVCPYCLAKISEEDRRRTTLCPKCFTRLEDDSKHCRACGLEIAPQALTPLPADRNCPRCEGRLQIRALGVADVIECGECLGIWLTPEIFQKVCCSAEHRSHGTGLTKQRTPRPAPRKMEAVKYIPCLTCGELMQRRQYQYGSQGSGIIVDQCGQHGFWLDQGELEQILEFIRAGGASASASHFGRPEPPISQAAASAMVQGPRGRQGPEQNWLTEVLETVNDIFFWR